LLEEAGEEPGAAGGGTRESTEDEKGVPHRPEGGRGICEDLVLEGGQQVEEETVQLQDGLGSLEGARAEAVGGKAELELPDAVVAVGAHGVEAPGLLWGQRQVGDDGVEGVARQLDEAPAGGVGSLAQDFADDDEAARRLPVWRLPG